MSNGDLKNRKRIGISLSIKLWERFGELSAETRIAKSKLMDEAILDLLRKYGKSEGE